MNPLLHWTAFLEYQQRWNDHYNDLKEVTLPIPGITFAVPLQTATTQEARLLRQVSMFMDTGHSEPDARFLSMRFEFVQMLLTSHCDRLQAAGLITFAVPGRISVVKPEALIALHLAVQGDPPPDPKTIDIEKVISYAKETCANWIKPPR